MNKLILIIISIFLFSSCVTQKSARSRYQKTTRNPLTIQVRPAHYNPKGPVFWETYLDRYKRNPNKYIQKTTVDWEIYLFNYNKKKKFNPSNNLDWDKYLKQYKIDNPSKKPPVKSKYQRFHRRKKCTL